MRYSYHFNHTDLRACKNTCSIDGNKRKALPSRASEQVLGDNDEHVQ